MQRDRPSWRRRLALLVAIAALPALSSAASIVDRDGLEFASTEALCSLHCKPWRRNRPDSQCDQQTCPQFFSSRRLNDDSQGQVHADATNVSAKLSVLSCGEADDSLRFSIDADASSISSIFRGFHDAFFGAFDALITSQNASVQACQLQWLQEDVLPVANATNATASPTVPQPMLVRLDPNADQRACVTHVKSIWTSKDESLTPFLSRADRSTGRSTVMLLHVDAATATRLAGLQCVAQVVELPAILKLLPFARSAFQLSNRQLDKAPALWVRVLKGSDPKTVYARLQSRLTAMDGVTNVFELPERPELFPRGIFVKSMAHLDLWSHAVALAVAETEVEWVDAKSELQFHTLKGYSRVQTQSRRLDDYVESLVGVEPAQERGIRGDDIIVGITDSGLYIDHDQFDQDSRSMYDRPDTSARKVVYYNAWADSYDQSETIICGHGTHVSGLLAGSSFSGQNPNFGIASNARIAFMDIGTQSRACAGQEGCGVGLATPADASQLLQSQIAVGAKIFSFSWGTPGSDYSVQARDLDDFVYNNPEILIVVAAGNSGEDSANGQGTISSPSGAKNVISVGASLNAAASFSNGLCPNVFNPSYVASFSSAGPTTDGRMKPDVVAPGMTLISSQSLAPGSRTKSSATCSLQGTSQATPVVTGIAVLLYQWLRDGWWKNGVKDTAFGMKKIPAALLKALLVHSGDALPRRMGKLPSTPTSCTGLESLSWSLNYPDVYQGYGKPNMSNIADFAAPGSTPTLYFLPNSTEGSEPSVAHDGEVRISFTVPRGVDLRATIVWTDPAGSIRATTQLQHDLDLSVQIRNTSQVFYPLTADKTTKRDQKNNVEMVQVSYQQLVDALQTEGNNSASLLGPNGEIIVDAIIYGRSVLQASAQAFAFVASSSVIGTTSGAATSPGAGGSISNSDKSFWTPWTIGGVGAGALVLLALIAICVRCCTSSKHRRPPRSRPPHSVTAGGVVSYHPYSTPAAGPRRAGLETCPYCAFACSDPVVMVNHVENMHANGAVGAVNGVPGTGFGLPPTVTAAYPPPYGAYLPPSPVPRSDERCPYCSFVSPDPVILVNHVEHMHGEQRVV